MSAANPTANTTENRFEPALMRRKLTGTLFYGLCLAAIGILLLALVLLLVDVATRGLPWLDGQFLSGAPSRRPERAGILPALVGSVQVGLIVGAITFPVGVAAAIYLAEYARDSLLNRLLQVNIANLAGVPSIVYGILGLALFVRLMNLERSVLAGGLTLGVLVMPVIIITAQEALRAVPSSLRDGSYALGATRWQTISRQVLPVAMPGILTGIILSMARAMGETAPLIL